MNMGYTLWCPPVCSTPQKFTFSLLTMIKLPPKGPKDAISTNMSKLFQWSFERWKIMNNNCHIIIVYIQAILHKRVCFAVISALLVH